MMRKIVYNTVGETLILDSPKRTPRITNYNQIKAKPIPEKNSVIKIIQNDNNKSNNKSEIKLDGSTFD